MKILWLCNVILPIISKHLSLPVSNAGGWLDGLSEELIKTNNIDFYVCFPNNEKKSEISGSFNNISYFGFNQSNNLSNQFVKILEDYNPDIIHIFGTEYKHTFEMVNASKHLNLLNKTVISIQGLVSYYAKHYYADLPFSVIYSCTLRSLRLKNNIARGKHIFEKKGYYEIESIRNSKNIIGRTDWDYACATQINPNIQYFFCNETLRSDFYSGKWTYQNCQKHSIFISQAYYPIKGFHKFIETAAILKKEYPDLHIYTTGSKYEMRPIYMSFHNMPYQNYLAKLIKKYNLENSITFLGSLSAKEMKKYFLKSNVFVLPSIIENSPNSLGEAMLLGVPCVSSDVGGVKNMLVHSQEGFIYPYNEPYVAAYYIKKIFDNPSLASNLSNAAQTHALITHSKEINNDTLLNIYNKISKID